jgi:3-oxoacyl-[acyl-carrier protein] reductase
MNILVTGGSGGLGAATVRKLADSGANKIYFTWSNSSDAAKELSSERDNCHDVHCDFTDPSSVDRLIESMTDMAPDVLINNAALPFNKAHFHKNESSTFLHSFENNVVPVIRITRAAINIFRKNKTGRIINVLSSAIAGTPPVGWSEYIANKNYILSLSRSWATENVKFNITSNCVSPSFMETRFTNDTDPRVLEQMISEHPLKKLLTPEEVADAILFLVNCSKHVNGINLMMNAGMEL